MELIIGGLEFSLEILVNAAVLDSQEMNTFWINLWVGGLIKGGEGLAVSILVII